MAILSTDELLLQRCMSPNLALRVIWVPRNYWGAFGVKRRSTQGKVTEPEGPWRSRRPNVVAGYVEGTLLAALVDAGLIEQPKTE
jgi:hypothetical protein